MTSGDWADGADGVTTRPCVSAPAWAVREVVGTKQRAPIMNRHGGVPHIAIRTIAVYWRVGPQAWQERRVVCSVYSTPTIVKDAAAAPVLAGSWWVQASRCRGQSSGQNDGGRAGGRGARMWQERKVVCNLYTALTTLNDAAGGPRCNRHGALVRCCEENDGGREGASGAPGVGVLGSGRNREQPGE
jgi:hypothetical protein